MIMATYFGSAVMGVVTMTSALSAWQFSVLVAVVLFIASAGASSAYLTVSEVFPMESLCIALFFAVATAVVGITGSMLFGQFGYSGSLTLVALGFLIGAGVMALGGVAEVFFGVRAEQQSLENIARRLTAEETASHWQHPGAAVARDERAAHRREHERAGARRYRPGPGGPPYAPGMAGTGGPTSRTAVMADRSHKEEIDEVAPTLERYGPLGRQALEQAVRGRAWGPGRFRTALKDTVEESWAQRLSSGAYIRPARAGR
ncbi:hypothetical protein ABZX64_36135 [Streptomyces misionensis]|uniref:hypothetical protein n=1 Tax=Streptomyces misionensis TaxID=67331 RepID=UPI0033A73E64